MSQRKVTGKSVRWWVVWVVCSVSWILLVGLVNGLQPENGLTASIQSTNSGTYEELQKLFLVDGVANDQFGTFVAMDGEFAVVSAYNKTVNGNEREGAAYVHRRTAVNPEQWELVTELTADDGIANSGFGWPVAISGDYVAVGAPLTKVNGVFGSPGAVYLFNRNEGGVDNWGQIAKLAADDAAADDYFGLSLTLEGRYLVVGAPRSDSSSYENQGAAYVYYQQSTGSNIWDQVQKITVTEGINYSGLGYGIDLSGNTLVIGAENFYIVGRPGVAYVFERETEFFTLTKKLTVTNGAGNNMFGGSIDIMGDTVVIGASNYANSSSAAPGSAYIFERHAGGPNNWGLVKEITAVNGTEDNDFGGSVSIYNDIILVGASHADAAYIFHRDAGGVDNWGQTAQLTATDNITNENERFGYQSVIEGETVLIGAGYTTIGANARQGAAYVFRVAPSYAITVSKSGTGTGTITSSLPGIDCGITCTAAFAIGEVVTLTAVPDSNSIFTGWSGACAGLDQCVLTMTQTQQVTAVFSVNYKQYLPVMVKE